MDSALLPRHNPPDEDAISIVAYGSTPPPSQTGRPSNDSRNSWRGSPSNIQTSYQAPDWTSGDGAVDDGSARRFALNERTGSEDSGDSAAGAAPSLRGGNSFRGNSAALQTPAASTMSVEILSTPPADTMVHPLKLYGKDIIHIAPFGSAASDVDATNAVKWSDTRGAVDTEDDYSIRDPHFDLSNSKINKLFTLSNPDERGMLSYEGFRCGLEAMGIACDSDQQFQAFVDVVDEDGSGDISLDEFQRAIQEIKLAQLFDDSFLRLMPVLFASLKSSVRLGAIEYSPDRIRSVYPIDQVQAELGYRPLDQRRRD